MILIYWLSATGGNVLSGILQPNVVSVGADAIVFGLLAITSVELIQNWPVRPVATSLSRLSFSFCRITIHSDTFLLSICLRSQSFVVFVAFVDLCLLVLRSYCSRAKFPRGGGSLARWVL
jgi:hypothetical protein